MRKVSLVVLFLILALATAVQAQTARLSWQDNSTNEDRFVVQMATDTFVDVGMVLANVTAFDHDVSGILAGTVLTYRVCAENVAGRGCSVGVKYVVPSQPPPAPTIPIPPGAVAIQWVCPAGKIYDLVSNTCK